MVSTTPCEAKPSPLCQRGRSALSSSSPGGPIRPLGTPGPWRVQVAAGWSVVEDFGLTAVALERSVREGWWRGLPVHAAEAVALAYQHPDDDASRSRARVGTVAAVRWDAAEMRVIGSVRWRSNRAARRVVQRLEVNHNDAALRTAGEWPHLFLGLSVIGIGARGASIELPAATPPTHSAPSSAAEPRTATQAAWYRSFRPFAVDVVSAPALSGSVFLGPVDAVPE